MDEDKQVIYKLKCISIISLIFMTVEIVGGIMANSVAILSDAFHLLSDILAYMISLQAVLMSHKKAPSYMTFGYEKLQPLGALVNVAIIWFVTFELLIEATQRIANQSVVKEPLYMLLTSFFGLGCNLYIMRVLHSDPHGGHSCSHDHGDHGHDHGHDHKHDHKHAHKHEEKDHHDHGKPGHKCSHHGENKEKEHNHNTHNHNHNHDHDHDHDHDHNHNHDHHQHGESDRKEDIEVNSNEVLCDVVHDHLEDKANCNNQGYFKITKESLSEDINHEMHNDHEVLNESTAKLNRKELFNNINIQAAYIHIISDIILSIGVIISALIIYFASTPDKWTAWQLADPFCTYLFSIMAIYSTIGIIKDSSLILLDGCDDPETYDEVVSELDKMRQIEKYENLRVWSLNRNKFAGAVKVTLKAEVELNVNEKNKARERIEKIFSSREIEYYLEILPQKQGQRELKHE